MRRGEVAEVDRVALVGLAEARLREELVVERRRQIGPRVPAERQSKESEAMLAEKAVGVMEGVLRGVSRAEPVHLQTHPEHATFAENITSRLEYLYIRSV